MMMMIGMDSLLGSIQERGKGASRVKMKMEVHPLLGKNRRRRINAGPF